MLGIDLVIPGYFIFDKNMDKIRGIVLTTDMNHIGALPYVLKQLNATCFRHAYIGAA